MVLAVCHFETYSRVNVKLKQVRHFIIGSCVALAVVCQPIRVVFAESTTISEYAIKAAFIVNILKFVSIPENSEEVTLCLVKDPNLDESFAQISGEMIGNRQLKVRFIEEFGQDGLCSVYFFSRMQSHSLAEILPRLASSRALTIGEDERFLPSGGAINFYTEKNRIRFEIRLATAERSGIKISSKLLQLAKIFDER